MLSLRSASDASRQTQPRVDHRVPDAARTGNTVSPAGREPVGPCSHVRTSISAPGGEPPEHAEHEAQNVVHDKVIRAQLNEAASGSTTARSEPADRGTPIRSRARRTSQRSADTTSVSGFVNRRVSTEHAQDAWSRGIAILQSTVVEVPEFVRLRCWWPSVASGARPSAQTRTRRADGYAAWPALALSGNTRLSWLREVMSSLPKTLRRW